MISHTPDSLIAFSPIAIGPVTLPTRVVLAPINTGFTKANLPDDRLIAFHDARSGNAIGASILGNVAVAPHYVTNANTACLFAKEQLSPYRAVVDVIKRNGSCAGIQLAAAPRWLTPSKKWAKPEAVREAELDRLASGIAGESEGNIEQLLSNFITSARLASEAGFDLIEIHAAHGYFLSLLLHPRTNPRTDRFAYDAAWVNDWTAELRSTCPNSAIVFRLSLHTRIQSEPEDKNACIRISKLLSKSGIDAIDLSCGMYTISRELIYPRVKNAAANYIFASELSRIASAAVICAGGISSEDIRTCDVDNILFGLGRPLLADPTFAQKCKDGNDTDVRRCNRTGRCHFFTRGKPHIECGTNIELGVTGG